MQLEQMFGYQPRVAQEERQQTYFVVGDLEGLSASALYMADKYYDFKNSGFQLHIHEDGDKITGAKIKPYGMEDKKSEVPLSNYEACMAEMRAINLEIPCIKKGS
ncbi:MAG: hypothetical protein PHH83_04320 [Patescibacteria group bacterium]|nr:hypothetical protein [Patescibacteria group bacterium]